MSEARSSDNKSATIMQGVHTIVAMPQWYVNFNLGQLLANGSTTDGGSLRDVSLQIGSGDAWLHGKVNRLAVNVLVPGSTTTVLFTVSFVSGTMDYYDVTTAPPKKMSCAIDGLQIAFSVDLGALTVDTSSYSALPAGVRTRIDGLAPGAFTVQQLFMDLEKADVNQWDKQHTKFPESMPPSAVGAFPTYMDTYLRQVQEAGGSILGYAVTVPDVKGPTPSFPPTSLEFVTNQYQGEGDKTRPDLDTINYLMMTGGAAFPKNLGPWWGNLVVPEDGIDNSWYGTMAMAKSVFVDKFLLPSLAPLVCGYWSLSDTKDGLAPKTSEKTGSFSIEKLGGTWSTHDKSRSHKTNTWSNDDVDYHFAWKVSLEVVPGTNKVVIERNVDFDLDFTHWFGIEGHAVTSSQRVWYNVPLTLTIKLIGIADGTLQVQVDSKTREPDPNTLYGDPYGWDIVRVEGSSSNWKDVGDTMDSVINDAAAMAVPEAAPEDIEKTVAHSLNLAPFVFPGGAELSMVNPVFNDEGDLLLGLSYKA